MIRFCEGEQVLVNGRLCIIKRIVSFDVIEVQDAETGVWKTVARSDVSSPLPLNENKEKPKIQEILTEKQKRIRDLRFSVIEPTLNIVCSEELILARATEAVRLGLLKKGDPSTIYDWRRKLMATGNNNLNVLAPPLQPTGGRGKHRLELEVDSLLMATVDGSFMTPQKKSAQQYLEMSKSHLPKRTKRERLRVSLNWRFLTKRRFSDG